MITLTKRCMKLYFRDKMNLFFSMLSILIIIALYVLFLGNVWGDSTIRAMPDANILMYSWLYAGVLAVATITTPMGALNIIMEDRANKIYKGLYASPVKRGHITGGYIFSAFAVGVVMAAITAVVWGIYIAAIGGGVMPIGMYFRVAALILLASFSNTAMVYFIVSFIKTGNAYNTASTILGTIIGFLMGIYLPIGVLPEAVQTAIKLFPPAHVAMLLRQTLMEAPIATSFENVPAEYLAVFNEVMGITFFLGDFEITPIISVAGLLITGVVFFGLAVWKNKK